ncbi:MAG TPA: hypothetical protein VGF14_06125 [Alphaproteobacteria bacterium]
MLIKQRTLIVFCGALFFLCASFAQAQAPAPFETTGGDPKTIQPVSGTEAEQPAGSDSKNAYLDTYLALQQQISILNKLLEREVSVSDMVRNYKQMGVVYDPPKPGLSMCRSVPQNLSCALAYPKIYASFLPPAPVPSAPIIPAVVLSDLPQPVTELSPETALKQLLWTDITCMGDICRAVITPDAENSGARYAIKVGDILPRGGVVESISAAGVFVSSGNKIISLDPAPLSPFALTARANSPS